MHSSKIFIVLVVMFAAFSSTTAGAETSHMRLLVHSHKQVHTSGAGLATWVVAPSLTDAPDQWLALMGPRYDGEGWNVELMGGAVIKAGNTTPLVDARLELTPAFFGLPLYAWANSEWIATADADTFYGYLQADHVLPKGVALIGAETEDVVSAGVTDLSVGPHIVVPMGQVALVCAYQFHNRGENQLWLRLVLNL